MYNVILFTDIPNPDHFTRGYGAYRLASEIRANGYSVLTVDFSSTINLETFTKIIENSVGAETFFVGFSTTWFPYRKSETNSKYIIGAKSKIINPKEDFCPEAQPWYFDSVTYKISQGDLKAYSDIIKNVNAKCKVVIGGAKSSEYVYEPYADNVFIGYSETMIIDYLNSISRRGPIRIFNKVIDYDPKAIGGGFDFKASSTLYVDSDLIMPEELLTMEFGRGCIFNCAFCSFAHRGSDTKDFIKFKETIYNELMHNWTKWGVYKYTINDDTFNDHTEKMQLIKEVIATLPFKPVFPWAFARLDLLARNPEQAQLFKDLNIKEVYYGLETFNNNTAKAINKGGKRERKIEGMRMAKECWGDDIDISVGIVVGLPKDTIQSINESVDWYINEGHKFVDNFKFVDLTIFPDDGTNKYKFLSDIEKDPAKFGYSFPDPDNKPYNWVLDDEGDIKNKQQAVDIMQDCNKRVKPYFHRKKGSEWDNFRYYDTTLSDSAPQAYYDYVTQHYFPKLLTFLNKNI
jgi:hypothetical protein